MTEPLRGAYIARLDLTQPHLAGVSAKIRGQIAALEELPARIELIHPTGDSILVDGRPWKKFGSGRFAKRWTYYFRFYQEFSRRADPLDFIYIRYQGCSPLFLLMLNRIRRRSPATAVFIELPSYPFHIEASSLREHLMLAIDRLTRGKLRQYVDRIVTFSRAERIFGIDTVRTDNGIDIAKISISPQSGLSDRLRLLGLANLSFWHGYDRVIEGLARHAASDDSRRVHFDIVGIGSELDRLRNRASELGVHDLVTFWGSQRGAALEEIASKSHVGISSIGMHRLNVDTSNLKSREFCARGLPFIHAYEDRDFNADLPFVLHIPADDSPVDIASIVGFYDSLRSTHPDFRSEMRLYAERNLTWSAKLRPVLEQLRDLIHSRSPRP